MVAGTMLRLGGAASLGVALLHLAVVFAGARGYLYFGAGERMADLAAAGSPMPAVITIAIAAAFAGFGACAIAAAGGRPWPAWLAVALTAITLLYLLRGASAMPQSAVLLHQPGRFPVRFLVFSLVSLVIGIVHLAGLVCAWKEWRRA
jgi:hypothetical protein